MYHPIASAFPFISEHSVFKGLLGEKEEIRHMEQANGYTVVCYLISGDSTFDNPYAVECRGLVFDKTGKLAARPLHKFFNLNERDGARPENFDWSKLARIMDKRDGSMIHTVRVDKKDSPFWSHVNSSSPADLARSSNFTLKSKKSFESDVALQARAWMVTRENFIDFCQQLTDLDATAIFEWTSPTARIVLPYKEDGLTLLHIRDNATGRYSPPGHLHVVADRFNIPVVKPMECKDEQRDMIERVFAEIVDNKDPNQVLKLVLELQETATDIEGWVFQFEDGQMVKVKTKWYMERHRAMTFLRERDIVGAVLNESLDDLKALLVGEGVDISEIVMIEERTVEEVRKIEASLDIAYSVAKGMTKKDAALKFGPAGEKFPLFGLLMNKMDGREPNIKAWYERNVLPTIPLRQLNLLQSVAEAE